MRHDVIVIGGGMSGLSAAVDLCARGLSVLVLERGPHLGGRAYSFVDEKTGDEIDNGQHLMMGCYHETRWLLRTIGSEQRATLQQCLHIDFIPANSRAASLHCPLLPAPLHILAGLIGLKTLSLRERMSLLKIGLQIHKHPETVEPSIAKLTVRQWLNSLGQSEESQKYLWDVIAIGSLNGDPAETSALLFYRVLRAAFLGNRDNASLLIPNAGLSRLFDQPAAGYIRSKQGEIVLSCGVEELIVDGANVTAVQCSDGSRREAKTFVCAVPWYALDGLLPAGEPAVQAARSMKPSSILSIDLWFDRPVMTGDFVALLDSRVQWVFNKSKLHGEQTASGQCLALTVSNADSLVDMETKEILALALEDLRRAFPPVTSARLVHSVVLKERRATFDQRPEVEACRPDCRTSLDNLFLAGDWTNTGYPATIEGAVMSGRKAASAASERLRSVK